MNSKEKQILARIANHLIINSSFLDNLGLFHGKMGIVIFFYHYSRYTNNSFYEEFAGELLDEIIEEIHDRLPIDFENGYLGIGWGIEYLAELKFIVGDTNVILEDIDKKIMERDIRRIMDLSLNTGLEGIFHYVLYRHCNCIETDSLFDKQYLDDLIKIVDNLNNIVIPKSLSLIINSFRLWILGKEFKYNSWYYFRNFYGGELFLEEKMHEMELGFTNGCTGFGLSLMNTMILH